MRHACLVEEGVKKSVGFHENPRFALCVKRNDRQFTQGVNPVTTVVVVTRCRHSLSGPMLNVKTPATAMSGGAANLREQVDMANPTAEYPERVRPAWKPPHLPAVRAARAARAARRRSAAAVIDGETSLLVRPYVLNAEERREEWTQRERQR
jgi:hypothetical protein